MIVGMTTAGNVGAMRDAKTLVCVVYDPDDGRIVHIHHSLALPNVSGDSREEARELALSIARERHERNDLRAIHVDPEAAWLREGGASHVDLQRLEVIRRDVRPFDPPRSRAGRTSRDLLIGVLAGITIGGLALWKKRR